MHFKEAPLALAIFDLDNTLLAGDSDHAWGQFLVEIGAVDPFKFKQVNDRFLEDYQHGRLDIAEYLRFALQPLAQTPLAQLHKWRADFFNSHIKPIILSRGQDLVNEHKNKGDDLLIITATNQFVTEPIAHYLGIDELIATLPEMIDGQYTGNFSGTPSFQEGKITRLNDWLKDKNLSLDGASFYSDSHNDLPLLRKVDIPVAVDPDPILRKEAEKNGWRILSLRS